MNEAHPIIKGRVMLPGMRFAARRGDRVQRFFVYRGMRLDGLVHAVRNGGHYCIDPAKIEYIHRVPRRPT